MYIAIHTLYILLNIFLVSTAAAALMEKDETIQRLESQLQVTEKQLVQFTKGKYIIKSWLCDLDRLILIFVIFS